MVDPELALAALSEGNNPLTPREREVLSASLFGASLAEIAARLCAVRGNRAQSSFHSHAETGRTQSDGSGTPGGTKGMVVVEE